MIIAALRSEANRYAIPGVDRANCERQIHQLFVIKVRPNLIEHVIRHASLGDERNSFGPGERGTFPFAVERRFTPGVEHIHNRCSVSSAARASLECISR